MHASREKADTDDVKIHMEAWFIAGSQLKREKPWRFEFPTSGLGVPFLEFRGISIFMLPRLPRPFKLELGGS